MALAIIFELIGTIHAKSSEGLTSLRPTIIMYLFYSLSVTFLALALDKYTGVGIDLGIAYATWSGLGTIVAVLVGVYWFGEIVSGIQIVGIVLTILGLVITNLAPSFESGGYYMAEEHPNEEHREENY